MSAWFDRLFFVAIDERRLAVQRIVTVLVAFWLGCASGVPRGLKDVSPEFLSPVTFARPLFFAGMPPDWLLVAAKWILLAALVLVLVGYRTRLASVVIAVVGLPYLGVASSFGKVTCILTPLYLTLLVGAFAPWGNALSLDAWRARRRPQASVEAGAYCRLLHALLAIFYFSSAVQKMRHAGFAWLSGAQLESYVLWMVQGRRAARWVVVHPLICQLLGIASVLFEGGFFLSFLVRRLLPLMVVSSILFHVGIWIVMGIDFSPVWPLLAACIPFERVFDRIDRWRGRTSERSQAVANAAAARVAR